jgi:hypothetical protein
MEARSDPPSFGMDAYDSPIELENAELTARKIDGMHVYTQLYGQGCLIRSLHIRHQQRPGELHVKCDKYLE